MPKLEEGRGAKLLVDASARAMATLAKLLRGMIARRVETPPETVAEAEELVALMAAHAKAVETLLKVEKQLERQRRATETVRADVSIEGTAFEIDLDGARGELLAELGRLQAEVEG
jgi:hypothetical protein